MIKNLDINNRKKYANLVIDMASENVFGGIGFSMGSINKITMKRRLKEMKTRGKKHIFLSCVFSVLLCFVGTVTSFAYNAPQMADIGAENFEQGNKIDIKFISDQSLANKIEALPYDYFFIDKDGNTYKMGGDGADTQQLCIHQFTQSGTVEIHNKKVDGSCEMIYKEGKRCTICGYIKAGATIKTVTYAKCPH